ncbi:MAG: alpha/beta fold hydrolase, partial [Myxococcota bacterium]|nr:alpha/beta fold hydrolase [Myxococcota bacterium]
MDERRVRVGDLEVAFEEAGAGGRALVLVHGFTGDRSDWDEVRGPLAEQVRVLTPDQRGHGATADPGRGEGYTLEGLAEDLAGFLDATDVARCDLLGHSMGGMVALRLALAAPSRVASLVLMDTASAPVPVLPRELLDAACRTAREQGMEAIYRVMHAGRDAGARAPASRVVEARMGETPGGHPLELRRCLCRTGGTSRCTNGLRLSPEVE